MLSHIIPSIRARESVLFQQMFQGHPIAETFSCGETKCRYLCQCGLAPHFSSLLKSRINKDSEYILLFDESMNKKTKNKHFRYPTSQFIDLLEHFNASTSDLRRNGLLQVSRNGPSVNWSFYDKLEKEIKNECDMGLLNIGSCGLHVIHGVFHTGARETDSGLDGLLQSILPV